MKRATTLALAGTLVLAACSDLQAPLPTPTGAAAQRALVGGEDFVPGQIIVRFTPGAARSEIAQAHRAKKKEDMRLPRTEILEVPVGEELATAAEMSRNPNVEFAEPDYIMKLGPCEVSTNCTLPDGSFFHYKWDLNNTGTINDVALGFGLISTGKADADMDWAEMYDYLGGGFTGGAVIGILDTGIRSTHQQFTGKIIAGMRFLGDGQPVTNFTDDHGHGSHVAGIAAGLGTAPVPGVGYGANIKLLIGKVCNSAGTCPSSATANGIVWAADNGANVINMSLGSFGSNPDGSGSAAQQASLQYAASKNVLPVCATGNDDGKVGYVGGVGYPSRFPECMAVGATSWSDTKASYSNYGPQIAISAPGGDGNPAGTAFSLILSASNTSNTGYVWRAGTSMATPEVAGLAAMIFATTPGITASAVRQRLIETADDVDVPGWDPRTGAGRINAYRAITGVSANAKPVADPGDGYAAAKGVAIQFDGTGSFDPNHKAITYAWNFGDPSSASNTSTLATPTHTYMKAGDYTVTLTVTDAAGLTSTSTTTASIPNIVPAVSALPGAFLLPGETYTASGSFTDADPDQWTATVNYGDGAEALALGASKTFSLSHQYLTAGTRTVTVAVSDDDAGTGTRTATVVVWTPQEGITSLLLGQINEETATANAQALRAKLQAAQASLDRGNTTAAFNQLDAFTNKVRAMASAGQMTATVAADLNAGLARVRAGIR